MRQIVLDTETTGLDPELGHRIIEIGCVELLNRRLTGNNYHQYLQPDRDIDEGALEVHGITQEFLADKPRFADVAQGLLEYLRDAELIIHNAPFDVGFLNSELRLLDVGLGCIEDYCGVVDTLKMARSMYPGQANSLDALCKRHSIDNSQRTLHGALLDAEILADVYLAMTGGQTAMFLEGADLAAAGVPAAARSRLDPSQRPALRVIRASEQELAAHRQRLDEIETESGGRCVWLHRTESGQVEKEVEVTPS
jgi:DNA polymerase-3 subunit epsilon